jgi:hypothetical protein
LFGVIIIVGQLVSKGSSHRWSREGLAALVLHLSLPDTVLIPIKTTFIQ